MAQSQGNGDGSEAGALTTSALVGRSMAYAAEIEQLFHLAVVRYRPIRRDS
jgi:hypothetical protein